MHILLFPLSGLVVSCLARFIVRGREPGGLDISMLIGIGGYFGRLLGSAEKGNQRFVMSFVAIDHRHYIDNDSEDMLEIRNWIWNASSRTTSNE